MTVQAVSRASDKPALIHTEDNLPEEVTLELRKGNLVRAADLAIEKAVPREKVRELQLSASRQFIEQLHNFEGAKELVSSYDLNDDEVRTILQKILENPWSHTESITWFNRKKGRMISATLAQRIQTDPTFAKYR
jgi:hypothetical protein